MTPTEWRRPSERPTVIRDNVAAVDADVPRFSCGSSSDAWSVVGALGHSENPGALLAQNDANGMAAAIGAPYGEAGGSITIDGGIITAIGGRGDRGGSGYIGTRGRRWAAACRP